MENLLDWDEGFCSIAAKKLFLDFIPTIDYIPINPLLPRALS
jgi:hypothetical protein